MKEKKKIIILQHIAQEFDSNKEYNEKQVNEILMQFFFFIGGLCRLLRQSTTVVSVLDVAKTK